MGMHTRKPWRKFHTYKAKQDSRVLRHALAVLLTAELAYGAFCLLSPIQFIFDKQNLWQAQWEWQGERTFGIQVDFKHGSLDLYQRNTYSQ